MIASSIGRLTSIACPSALKPASLAIAAASSASFWASCPSRSLTLVASCTTSSRLIAKRFATCANGCQKTTATASRPGNCGAAARIASAASEEPS